MRQVKAARRAAALAMALSLAVRADQVEYMAYYYWDETENNVATSSFSMAKTLWQRTVALLDIELDQVTFPALDGVSSASRPMRRATQEFRKSRGQVIAGAEQALGGDTRAAANYYFSQEVDYRSQAVMGSLTQELFQKNLTVSLRAQYTWDSVGEITTTGALINRFKETHQASLAVTQLLSPTTILRVGGDGFRLMGYLQDPYRDDSHPDQRWRQAAWGELSQYLRGLDGSLVANYRYYWDDWDVVSQTVKLRLNKYLNKDWIFSPWYRYYIQSGAYFAGNGKDEPLHTGDYKLTAFESNTMGADLTWYLRSLGRKRASLDFLANSSVSLLYFHYFNNAQDRRFSCDVVQTRIGFSY